jgi:Ni,Fe-hydrogenase III large subunit
VNVFIPGCPPEPADILRGVLQPGGLNRELAGGADLRMGIESVLRDFEEVLDLCWNTSMLRDRLRATGRLARNIAQDHGMLGYVAHASGIGRDVRRDHPFAAYNRLKFSVSVLTTCDVEARAIVRVEEFRQSAGLVIQALEGVPEGKWSELLGALPAWGTAFRLVEGWRGGILH